MNAPANKLKRGTVDKDVQALVLREFSEGTFRDLVFVRDPAHTSCWMRVSYADLRALDVGDQAAQTTNRLPNPELYSSEIIKQRKDATDMEKAQRKWLIAKVEMMEAEAEFNRLVQAVRP